MRYLADLLAEGMSADHVAALTALREIPEAELVPNRSGSARTGGPPGEALGCAEEERDEERGEADLRKNSQR